MTKRNVSDDGKLHNDSTFAKTPIDLIHDLTVTDGATRLYAHMYWRYGANKTNFEGQKSIAGYLGVSRTTVHNRVNELVSHDWIVVVYRERSKKTGNFTTPFYHVFVSQADCRKFREEYKPAENEIVSPKPETVERKTRKGKGGNPNLNRVNSGLHGGVNLSSHRAVNLSSDGGVNLSSDNLDTSYLDTKESSLPSGKVDPEFEIIASVWETRAGGYVSNIQGMLFASKKVKGKWKECEFNPVATVDEVREFGAYATKRAKDGKVPTQPDTIQRWFYDYRAEKVKRAAATPKVTMLDLSKWEVPELEDVS